MEVIGLVNQTSLFLNSGLGINIEEVKDWITELGYLTEYSDKDLTKITYSELKTLRDNGQLTEGHLYRITDYVTTTVQSETKSANHPFDIIVTALSKNTLGEKASAIAHEGDTYFDGNDLGAWQLWYDLDNNDEKYAWADVTNGKGVIYRMIDEKRNDCPYDFKNILIYNSILTSYTSPDNYYYTFSYVVSGKLYDGTVEKQVNSCYGNSMEVYKTYNKNTINRNVFRNISFIRKCYYNIFGPFCNYSTFGDGCCLNTFNSNCSDNVFESYCTSNKFGYNCSSNIIGSECHHNTFGDNCRYNKFNNNCDYNTFGNNCTSNTFGSQCDSNTFGYGCYANKLAFNCYNNTFKENCYNNTLGLNCIFDTFGNACGGNILRDGCKYRYLDNNKESITLNDEYYDDGSDQLVPIKQPDLSTLPSILPYKFMGLYVYEQLIPNSAFYYGTFNADTLSIPHNKILFLEIEPINSGYPRPVYALCGNDDIDGNSYYSLMLDNVPSTNFEFSYLRIVYTSMPQESDYYGYNSY